MPARMGILHFSLLLLLMGNSNGDDVQTQSDVSYLHGNRWPSINMNLDDSILLPSHLIRKLQSVQTESETYNIISPLNYRLSDPFDIHSTLSLTRQKRQLPILHSSLSHDFLFKAKTGTIGSFVFIGGETNLDRIENRLNGLKGKLDNINLSGLESRAETKMFKEITKLIRDTRMSNIQRNFDMTRKLISNGIIEDHAISVVLQGMISDESIWNKFNLAEVKVTIKEVDNFINQESSISKADILQGFELVSASSDVSKIEPLVSRLLNLITEFKQRLNHLQSLPEKNQEIKIEIERSGGYYEYLQPSTLQDTLYDIIDNDLAIPRSDSDTTALALLELLVNGLQIHANLLSFVVSANMYTAGKALRNRDLEEFNMHMIQVESAISRVQTAMGNSSYEGLLSNVTTVLDKVEQNLNASRVDGLNTFLNDKRIQVNQVESDIHKMIGKIAYVHKPETVTKELDFNTSSIKLPIGHWKMGNNVSYAIQYVSGNRLSEVSDWSRPYIIQDKAHPTVHIPATENGMTRLVYRKFNEDKPELVAVLTDDKQNSFRDINKDIANYASRTINSTDTVREVTDLLDDGANVDVTFENEMTPLHYAAKYDNVEVMNILINKNADVRAKSLDGIEPIHLAALSDATEAIEILYNKGADINAQSRLLGLSPLHIAAANNNELAVESLIYANASVNIKDNNGLSPLHYAVAGNEEALEVLLESDDLNINAVTKSGLTPLYLAAIGSNGFLIRKLLKRWDINVNPLPDSHLSLAHLASIYEKKDTIGSMVQGKRPTNGVDREGSTPLHYAAFYGNINSVLALAELDEKSKGVLNDDNKTALDIAIQKVRESAANILRANRQNIGEVIKDELQKINSVSSVGNGTPTTLKCDREIAKNITLISGEICDHIGHVDSYVYFVKFMIPLEKYYEGKKNVTKIFTDYDEDLKAAQDHVKMWRDVDDNIVKGIRKTFDLAKEFEPEFSRKYLVNKRRVKKIKKESDKPEKVLKIEREITKLEGHISLNKQILNLTTDPSLIEIINEMLSSNQERLNEQQMKLKGALLIIQELSELAKFLEFVKTDALEIKEAASSTRENMIIFKDHLMRDKEVFRRHGNVSKSSLNRLRNQITQNNRKLAKKIATIDLLESEVEDLGRSIANTQNDILDIEKPLNDLKWSNTWRTPTAIGSNLGVGAVCAALAFIPVYNLFSMAACAIDLLSPSIGFQTTFVIQEKKILNMTLEHLKALKNMTAVKNETINKLNEEIDDASTESFELRNDRNQLSIVVQDLKNVMSYSGKLVNALDKALRGMTDVYNVFDGVVQKLENMIKLAQSAGDEAANQNAVYFTYESISEMECDFEGVYYSILDLEQCKQNLQMLKLN